MDMSAMSADDFTKVARSLQAEAVRLRLVAPAFRSPPHAPGQTRTLRRTRADQVVCAVDRWREPIDVTGDMIAGVIAANRLTGEDAEMIRGQLWQAAGIAVA